MKTVKEQQEVEIAGASLGTQSISSQKVAGAAFAAKGALALSKKLLVKYNEAKDDYAKKAAVAEAAEALESENQVTLNTVLPTHNKLADHVKQHVTATLSNLRKLYHAATQGLLSDQRYLMRARNSTQELGESFESAKADEKRAAYEHKYAARLHKTLISKKLIRMKEKQQKAEMKVQRDEEEVSTYKHEEDAVQMQAAT